MPSIHPARFAVAQLLSLLLASCASGPAPLAREGGAWNLSSPGGNLKVVVSVDGGHLSYAVAEGGIPILAPSPLGIVVDGVDLGDGAALGEARARSIDETYPVLGNHAVAKDRANEASIPVVSHGKAWTLQVRAQDDGVAVRYLLPEGSKHLDGESTAWKVAGAKNAGWQDFQEPYEGHDHWTPWAQVPENGRVSGLMTVEIPGHFLFLSEADNANYPDAAFMRKGDAVAPSWYASPKGIDIDQAHLATPWRTTAVAKNLTELVNCDLITNLCPPPAKGTDFSFVKPGRVMWQWCSVGAPRLADQHDWYDAAAKLGWEYHMIDDGWRDWRKDGKDQWALLTEVIAYGKTKGVETIIWVDSKEFLKSPEARRAYLAKVKASGAVGIKIDFLPAASEKVTAWCEDVLRDTAELKIMTIFHGCAKPTGRERTWPHALVREGVRGNEWHMTRYGRLAPMDHDVTQPFTRFLAGAGDITPVVLDPAQLRGYTWPHMFAQGLTTLSPLECFYDKWSFYTESPAADLFREIPVVWDETRVLPCTQIGKVAAFARRKGGTWWIGVVNGKEAAKVEIPLDFLKGPAKATLLRDAKADAAFDRQETPLGPADKVVLELRPGGGFAARLKMD